MANFIAATLILLLTLYGVWYLTGVVYGYFFSEGEGGSAEDAGSLRPRCCAELRRKLIAAQRAGIKRTTAHLKAQAEAQAAKARLREVQAEARELRRKLFRAEREAAGDKRRALLDALRRTVESP